MVQKEDVVMMCRDGTVGGMMQQGNENDDNGIMICGDGATCDMMQHIGDDDVFADSEQVIKSDDRDCEGVVDSKSVDTNISMRSSRKSRSRDGCGAKQDDQCERNMFADQCERDR